MIRTIRTALLVAFELGALAVETALIATTVHNIMETLQHAQKPATKPEERRWVN